MYRPMERMGDRAVRGSLREVGTWLHIALAAFLAACVFFVASLLVAAVAGADEVAFAPLEALVLGGVLIAVARWRTRRHGSA